MQNVLRSASSLLPPATPRVAAVAAAFDAAATPLPVQIEAHNEVRRRALSLIAEGRPPGRRGGTGIDAAVLGSRRRVFTPPPPLRPRIIGGAATSRQPASARVRRDSPRVPARAGSTPATSTPLRQRPPPGDVTATPPRAWAGQAGLLAGPGWCAPRPAFFSIFFSPCFCFPNLLKLL